MRQHGRASSTATHHAVIGVHQANELGQRGEGISLEFVREPVPIVEFMMFHNNSDDRFPVFFRLS